MRDNRLTWWFWVPALPKPLIVGAWALFHLVTFGVPYAYYYFNPGQPLLLNIIQGLGGSSIGMFTWAIIAIQLNTEVVYMVFTRKANERAVERAAEDAAEAAVRDARPEIAADIRAAVRDARPEIAADIRAVVRAEIEEGVKAVARAEIEERVKAAARPEITADIRAEIAEQVKAAVRAERESRQDPLLAWYQQVKDQLPAGTPPPPGIDPDANGTESSQNAGV